MWMVVGFLVYGCYGWRNSSEEYKMKGLKPPQPGDTSNTGLGDFKLSKVEQDKNSNYFDDFE